MIGKSRSHSKNSDAGSSTSRLAGICCFLFDMDGTICLDDQLLPGAHELLAFLNANGVPFYFITNNSSRSRREYALKLSRLGLSYGEERIFTSGEATAIYLRRWKAQARLFVVGTPSLEEEMTNAGFVLVQEKPDAIVLGFDTTLTYGKLQRLCDLVRSGTPYFATHPDINCPTETGFIPDIGATMAFVEASTGRKPDIVIGKPNQPMVEAIVEKTGIPAEAMAMVGDRLYTDIAMGQSGLITILVLSGETHLEDVQASEYKPDFIFRDLADFLKIYRTI